MKLIKLFYKCIYYSVVLFRQEWIWTSKRNLNKSQYNSINLFRSEQLEKLNIILAAACTSEFYKNQGLPLKLNSLDEITKLPFLEKEDLRDHAKTLETDFKSRNYTVKTSGGSTGAPVTIRKPAKAMAHELAAAWRGYSWAGIEIGDLQARFWGVPMTDRMKRRAKLIDLVARRERFSAFKFDERDLEEYVKLLERKKPAYFYGYVSMLQELATHVIENNKVGLIRPKAIITTSEVLTSAVRELLQNAFLCKVFDEYGCGEVGTIAHECEHGSMHINVENVLIEIVDEEGNVLPEGQTGEIVVTDLNNDYMPLIRYRLRDFGSLSYIQCACKRTLPILNEIKGRAYDFIENEAGKKFHGEFFLYIIEDLKNEGVNLRGIQFIRESTHLQVLISSNKGNFEKAENYIRSKLNSEFSENIPVKINLVEFIKREPSGKLRVIKSNV